MCCAHLQEGRKEDTYVIHVLESQLIKKEEECTAAKQELLGSKVSFGFFQCLHFK